MIRTSKAFIGFHSFKAFTSGARENYNSVIYKIKFKRKGDFLTITFVGKSFYRYMVRNMVGLLIEVGSNNRNVEDVKKILDSMDRKEAGICAPSMGLYLANVYYC